MDSSFNGFVSRAPLSFDFQFLGARHSPRHYMLIFSLLLHSIVISFQPITQETS